MKRIKQTINCPNPLFEQWLEEWKQEAAMRNSPIQYAFGKALTALKKYPLPLESGRECRILQHFGNKLCDMIDKKLAQYRELHNLPLTLAQDNVHHPDIGLKKTKKPQKRKAQDDLPDFVSDNNIADEKQNNTEGEVLENILGKRKAVQRALRPYLPKVGSSPYALLTTLYRNMQNVNYPGFMFKKDLISEAQEICDSPMKGTALEHYSGWSSMSTLIEKNLVVKKGNPSRYSLTDGGFALAMSLLEAKANSSDDSSNDPFHCNLNRIDHTHDAVMPVTNESANNKWKTSTITSKTTNKLLNSKSNGSSSSASSCRSETTPIKSPLKCKSAESTKYEKKFNFGISPAKSTSWEQKSSEENLSDFKYLQKSPVHLDLMVKSSTALEKKSININKEEEIVVIDDDSDYDEVFNYDREFKSSELKSSGENLSDSKYLQKSPVHLDLITGNSSPSKKKSTNINDVKEIMIIDSDDDEVFKCNGEQKTDDNKVDFLKDLRKKQSNAVETKSTSSEDFDEFCKENVEPVITVKKSQEHFIFTESLDLPVSSNNFEKIETVVDDQEFVNNIQERCNIEEEKIDGIQKKTEKSTKSQKKKASLEDMPYESFFLLPNNFDIILLVDTQETSGRKVRPKDDETISELSKLKVLFEVRSLKVGDFTWIARCRFTNKELILPYIVERKRIDDLASSIQDGRYHEQKFRLRQSAIKNVIYMIESYGKNYHGGIPLTSLLQAGVNSLIQDNFTVKYTRDHRDSMYYLATMTAMLNKTYEASELTSCRKKDLESEDSESSMGTEQLMEFSEFNKTAAKTKNFKVREILIRQLLQLKGVSAEKAVAISEFYPTPKVLAEAFKDGGEKLLSEITAGGAKRKIGPAISKTFYQLYARRDLN